MPNTTPIPFCSPPFFFFFFGLLISCSLPVNCCFYFVFTAELIAVLDLSCASLVATPHAISTELRHESKCKQATIAPAHLSQSQMHWQDLLFQVPCAPFTCAFFFFLIVSQHLPFSCLCLTRNKEAFVLAWRLDLRRKDSLVCPVLFLVAAKLYAALAVF